MHRVQVFVRAARRFNAVLRKGELVAVKPIARGERIVVNNQKPFRAESHAAAGAFTYGRRLGHDDTGTDPYFDDERYVY